MFFASGAASKDFRNFLLFLCFATLKKSFDLVLDISVCEFTDWAGRY
jgi:hypothetical protein